MSSTLNIKFQPVTVRNYTPERSFVTKWDIEIEKTRTKKISRRRERDSKYFDYFEQYNDSLPVLKEVDRKLECAWELDEDSQSGWLRSIYAENAYYNRKCEELKGNFEWYDMDQPETAPCKRNIDFDEYGTLKRIRA